MRRGLTELLKFTVSSMIGFFSDYLLYGFFVLLTGSWGELSVPISNITARILSASINFTINRHIVYHSRDGVWNAGLRYAILAACILAGNTLLLSSLINCLKMDKYAAKMITEMTFFAASWLAQRYIVFRRQRGEAA